MYRLPLLLDLVKAFGLRLPDRTAFEQARMIFGIEGPQMRVHGMDLIGNAISLRGQGRSTLMAATSISISAPILGHVPQMLPPLISDLSQAFNDQLFKIKVRGKITAPRFDKELIPGVVEPIKKVFGENIGVLHDIIGFARNDKTRKNPKVLPLTRRCYDHTDDCAPRGDEEWRWRCSYPSCNG